MRKLLCVAALLAWCHPIQGVPPVPRRSPEFTIVEPSGKQTPLSAFKGKVVMLEFLLVDCPHCQRVAGTMTRLQRDLGPRGFQPLGVAFNPNVGSRMVTDFVQWLQVTYPVGYSSHEEVDAYLGRSLLERLMVPQVVIVDRQGVIRAQSGPKGDPNPDDEGRLRALIESLLRVPAR